MDDSSSRIEHALDLEKLFVRISIAHEPNKFDYIFRLCFLHQLYAINSEGFISNKDLLKVWVSRAVFFDREGHPFDRLAFRLTAMHFDVHCTDSGFEFFEGIFLPFDRDSQILDDLSQVFGLSSLFFLLVF